ncbi:MAG: phosphoribosyltransferase [Desulfobacteraceae bacterium]|nr:MAG: phosphoribosyltransferase [Desulfobacteraceae bacterium]
MVYKDRLDAGRRLAEQLIQYRQHPQAIVLALPRGGVPVGFGVCQLLGLPLDIFVVRKIGVPGHEETAMGAIASGGVRVLNKDIIRTLGIRDEVIAAAAAVEQVELERRESLYRGDRFLPDLTNRIVILVDDGMATGASMAAAVQALTAFRLRRLVVAVPVADQEVLNQFKDSVDELICPHRPPVFQAVSLWYEDFSQTTDEQVRAYLRKAEEIPVNRVD